MEKKKKLTKEERVRKLRLIHKRKSEISPYDNEYWKKLENDLFNERMEAN